MPTWKDRLEKARQAAQQRTEEAVATAKDLAGRATPIAQQRAEEAVATAKDLAERATPVAQQQAARGKALVNEKLADRKAAQERRTNWFLSETRSIYTAGYPDDESMRLGIQTAAEHGWTVQNVARVPETRLRGMGLTGVVAKEALQRVRQADKFLVTFNRIADPPEAAPTDAEPEPPPSD